MVPYCVVTKYMSIGVTSVENMSILIAKLYYISVCIIVIIYSTCDHSSIKRTFGFISEHLKEYSVRKKKGNTEQNNIFKFLS